METAELRLTLGQTLSGEAPIDGQTLNLACFWITKMLDEMPFPAAEPPAVARRLLRVVGRILIDSARTEAKPADWESTRPMVLLWLNEALNELGYEARPRPGSGEPELQEPTTDWE